MKNANDNTVEGVRHKHKPFFSVQFHPEATPGPVDTNHLFDKFMEISRNIKAKDFEMEKFAAELLKRDQEKLELMRKIDTLERMLASMQRRR